MGAGRTQFDNGTANQNRNQDVDIGNDPSASRSTAGVRYTADVSTTAFEVDLFGRLQSLSDAALNRYFGTEAAARATRLTLIGDVADAWLTYAADRSLLKLAEDTAANAREQVKLTRLRLDGGIAPRTDLRQAEQILATAEADIAQQKTALAQDINALQLLVGAPVEEALLPQSIADAGEAISHIERRPTAAAFVEQAGRDRDQPVAVGRIRREAAGHEQHHRCNRHRAVRHGPELKAIRQRAPGDARVAHGGRLRLLALMRERGLALACVGIAFDPEQRVALYFGVPFIAWINCSHDNSSGDLPVARKHLAASPRRLWKAYLAQSGLAMPALAMKVAKMWNHSSRESPFLP